MAKSHILVVEDDVEMLSLLHDELGEAGFDVHAVPSAQEALEHVRVRAVDAVVTDLVMPGMRGDELLRQLRAAAPGVPVVIMTAFGSIESAVAAMREGAYHYITKPFRIEQLIVTLENALAENQLRQDLLALAGVAQDRAGIVAESPVMRRTMDLVARAAPADTPVLVLGESGTGKELLARALHVAGPRRDRPFMAVNCSAIPETLLESQLFGHRRGAFTDAREDRRGLFQEAEGGTILLDEIGDMASPLQAKLLRVLQEKEVHPLGAAAPVAVDVRVIAATNRDLEALCAQGRFRQDLYYRLNVIAIRIPPLRERPEDLLPLVAHFLAKHGQRLGRAGATVGLEVMELFRRHPWPGNVRELENAIERALVLGRDSVIHIEDLPDDLRRSLLSSPGPEHVRLMVDMEREQIIKALRAAGGNKTAAARLLGLDRKTLYRKLEVYGIQPS
jgi:two-component system response regulator HydG